MHDNPVLPAGDEEAIRFSAIEWIRTRTLDGTKPVTRDELANNFHFGGLRFPLVDRGRGIRKPNGWAAALSILTAAPKSGHLPYEDREGPDGLHRYKLRRDQRGTTENESLRTAMREQLPIIWFVGVEPGVFNAIAPVYLLDGEIEQDQFVLALTEDQLTVSLDSPMESALRRYLLAETKRRLINRCSPAG